MLIASFLQDQANELGTMLCWMAVGIAIVIHYAKKFGNANPDVKDAAKKAAASTVIRVLGRMFNRNRRTGLSCPQFHRKGDFNMLLASWLGEPIRSSTGLDDVLGANRRSTARRSSAKPTRKSRTSRRRLRLPRRLNISVASSRSKHPAGGIRPSRHFKRKEEIMWCGQFFITALIALIFGSNDEDKKR